MSSGDENKDKLKEIVIKAAAVSVPIIRKYISYLVDTDEKKLFGDDCKCTDTDCSIILEGKSKTVCIKADIIYVLSYSFPKGKELLPAVNLIVNSIGKFWSHTIESIKVKEKRLLLLGSKIILDLNTSMLYCDKFPDVKKRIGICVK